MCSMDKNPCAICRYEVTEHRIVVEKFFTLYVLISSDLAYSFVTGIYRYTK